MKRCIAFILLLITLRGLSQSNISNISNYGVNEGLSQNSVYVIMQDRQGFAWIGTGDGLARFDGRKFRIFRSRENDTSHSYLPGSIVNSLIVEDRDDRLWFNTNKGLVILDKKTEKFHIIASQGKSAFTFAISFMPLGIDEQDSLWGYISGVGIGAIHTQNLGYTLYKTHLPPSPSNSNATFQNGIIYIAGNNGVFNFDTRTHLSDWIFPGRAANCICPLSNGSLLIGGREQLINYNPKTRTTVNLNTGVGHLPPISWKSLAHGTSEFSIGISISGDIYRIQWSDSSIHKIDFSREPNASGLSDYLVNCLFTDNSENLWIGTDGAGFYIVNLKKKKFNRYPELKEEGKNLMVKGLFADDHHNILIGTYSKGLTILNTTNHKSTHVNLTTDLTHKPDPIFFIYKDSSGRIWLNSGSNVGYLRKDYSGFEHSLNLNQNSNLNTPLTYPYTIFEVRKNEFLIGANNGYHNFRTDVNGRILPDSTFKIPISYSGFVYTLKRGRDGSIYIGKIRGGFWRIKITGKDIIRIDSAFLNTGIRDFYFCKTQPIVWMASEEGLIAYDPTQKTYRIFDESDGMSNQYIYGILAQNDRSLWFSTNKGINHASVTYDNNHSIKDISFTYYSYDDGLQSNEFNSGAFFKSPFGDFIFGGVSGINWFNPDSIVINPHRGIPAITSIHCNDKPLTAAIAPNYLKSLTLSSSENTLLFEFASLEFTNPETNLFSYRLKGLESKWSTPSNINTVKYANLAPGSYTFELKASNNDRLWSEPLQLKITITPPFWQTWWFRILVTAILILLTIIITKLVAQRRLKRRIERLEQREALNQERERIAREMHDDIGAGLTQISLISENIQRHTEQINRAKASEIGEISRGLISNISEIIWSLNPENKSFPQLISYLRDQIHKQLEYASINYQIEFPEKIPNLLLTTAQRRNILMITKEIIRNSIRHSGASNLSVKLEIQSEQLRFEIADNGTGFPKEQIHSGNGLKNIQKRISELKGTIHIDSQASNGTRFQFTIPIITT